MYGIFQLQRRGNLLPNFLTARVFPVQVMTAMLVLLGPVVCLQDAFASDHSLNELILRLDQLESENLKLRSRVGELETKYRTPDRDDDVQAVFADEATSDFFPPAPVDPEPMEFGHSSTDDGDHENRLSSLESAFHNFVTGASKTKYPTASLGGVFQADAAWFDQNQASIDDYHRVPNGADFRRFRISSRGQVAAHTHYFAQVDFGFIGRPTIQDLYVDQTDVPVLGNVRIGQWKQPFSLEVVSSFRYTTFMERSVLFVPFTAFRHIGVGFFDSNDEQDMTWAASFFAGGNDQFGGSISLKGGYGSAERMTFLPVWDLDGRKYLHLGVAHYFSAPNDHKVNFRTIPEAFVGANPADPGTSGAGVSGRLNGTPPFVSTGNIHVSSFNVIGTELLWVNERFSLQSEAMVNFVNTRDQVANPEFVATQEGLAVLPGVYAQVGYFLTDDYRPYDRKSGAIDRIIPRSSVSFCQDCISRGWGAWEVAARFSYLNLNDRSGTGIKGGDITDYTFGLNWYTTPYTKFVFNYIHSISEPGTVTGPIVDTKRANTDIFMTRFQVDY